MIALAVAEIGAIAQRRVALIVDPVLSYNLPPFLTPNPGLNSGGRLKFEVHHLTDYQEGYGTDLQSPQH